MSLNCLFHHAILSIQGVVAPEYERKEVFSIKNIYETGDTGFCPYLGSTGLMTITWEDDTVISVDCAVDDCASCAFSKVCELYQRHPVGFVKPHPMKKD